MTVMIMPVFYGRNEPQKDTAGKTMYSASHARHLDLQYRGNSAHFVQIDLLESLGDRRHLSPRPDAKLCLLDQTLSSNQLDHFSSTETHSLVVRRGVFRDRTSRILSGRNLSSISIFDIGAEYSLWDFFAPEVYESSVEDVFRLRRIFMLQFFVNHLMDGYNPIIVM